MNALDQDKIIPLEDIMQCQIRCQRQDDGNTSEKQFAVYEVSSIYDKVVKEKFGDQKHGRVRDLINFFEGKKMNLDEKQETITEKNDKNC